MEYTGVNLFVQQLVQMFIENKVLAAVTWIIFMGFVLRKLAKKEEYLAEHMQTYWVWKNGKRQWQKHDKKEDNKR